MPDATKVPLTKQHSRSRVRALRFPRTFARVIPQCGMGFARRGIQYVPGAFPDPAGCAGPGEQFSARKERSGTCGAAFGDSSPGQLTARIRIIVAPGRAPDPKWAQNRMSRRVRVVESRNRSRATRKTWRCTILGCVGEPTRTMRRHPAQRMRMAGVLRKEKI